jgi:hypothetical protein
MVLLLILICRILLTMKLITSLLYFLFLFCYTPFVSAQLLDMAPYPKGIYLTLDDLINANPSEAVEFTTVQGYNTKTYILKGPDNKRIKKPFAVSDGVGLYIHSKQVKKLIKGRGKGMQGASGNAYNKVLVGNRLFFYFEDYFASVGSMFMGGLSGVYTTYLCGVVFDTTKRKTSVFRKPKDINAFFLEHRAAIHVDLPNRKLIIDETRNLMIDFFNLSKTPLFF